jgi:hypothetical protein
MDDERPINNFKFKISIIPVEWKSS